MGVRATARMELKEWEEQPYHEIEGGGKLTRASVTRTFHGDIDGEGTLLYLMAYRDDGSAGFVGLERIVGRVADRSGSFVLRHDGAFEGGTARANVTIEPGTGTGDLRGLRGTGTFVWPHGQPGSLTLDYEFA